MKCQQTHWSNQIWIWSKNEEVMWCTGVSGRKICGEIVTCWGSVPISHAVWALIFILLELTTNSDHRRPTHGDHFPLHHSFAHLVMRQLLSSSASHRPGARPVLLRPQARTRLTVCNPSPSFGAQPAQGTFSDQVKAYASRLAVSCRASTPPRPSGRFNRQHTSAYPQPARPRELLMELLPFGWSRLT